MTGGLKDISSLKQANFVHDDRSHEHLEYRVIFIYI
jgi:hypothetical protein